MKTNALVALIATIGVGLSLFGIYVSRGGLRQFRLGRKRLRPQLVVSHMVLGFAALAVWIVFLTTGSEALAWISVGALALVTVLGSVSYYIWQRRRLGVIRATRARYDVPRQALGSGSMPAEQYFPVSVVVLHGLFAVGTLVLVLQVALTVHNDRVAARDANSAAARTAAAKEDAPAPPSQVAPQRPERVRAVRADRRVRVAFQGAARRTEVRIHARPRSGSLRRVVVRTAPGRPARVRIRVPARARYASVTSLGPSGERSLTVRVRLRRSG